MIPLTERYLAAALRSIPDAQRADVERELRSSLADAVEDRVAAGEERVSAVRRAWRPATPDGRCPASSTVVSSTAESEMDAGRGPELARGDGPVMLILAAGVTLVTAWEIFDAFRRARRARTVAMATEA